MIVFVGTYTQKTASKGIYTCLFEPRTGALRIESTAAAVNPSFLALAPGGRSLFAVEETTEFRGAPSGAVLSFAVEPRTGTLSPRNSVPSRGTYPCSVAVDATGRWAAVANYGSGTAALFPVLPDGSLGEAADLREHEGRGPDAKRQEGPHAHCVLPDPAGRLLFCADLGIDKVMIYRLDPSGKLLPHDQPWVSLHPGAGPRHLRFHPDGRRLYAINELDSTVSVLSPDAAGRLSETQTLSTLPPGWRGDSTCADIRIAPSGRFLYGSNRGHDSIAIFRAAEGTGALTPVGHEPTRGRTPRSFALDPSGAFLLAANQESNEIVVFSVDLRTGLLSDTGNRLAVPAPVCVLFSA